MLTDISRQALVERPAPTNQIDFLIESIDFVLTLPSICFSA